MKELIEVFRMNEISPKIRASIIIKLGSLINNQFSANITEPIVWELVKILDPTNKIINEERYISSMDAK
ncbi:MAG: hypothetical protein LBT79_00765 [Elusimicrobiota bacterium]|jgi:hypothetical protein|nr:hypothetical protein [Elusimicrobiota bacterium]